MDIKNTVILLILLLSIIGLLAGASINEYTSNDNSQDVQYEKIHEENDGVLTVTLKQNENNDLNTNSS